MSAIAWRAPVRVLLSWCIALAPVLVPEHRHDGDAEGPGSTLHRHLAPHHAEASPHDGARFGHPDDNDHVVWLAAAWLQTPAYDPPPAATVRVRTAAVAVDSGQRSSLVLDEAAPPHGPPPSPSPLRAPPNPRLS